MQNADGLTGFQAKSVTICPAPDASTTLPMGITEAALRNDVIGYRRACGWPSEPATTTASSMSSQLICIILIDPSMGMTRQATLLADSPAARRVLISKTKIKEKILNIVLNTVCKNIPLMPPSNPTNTSPNRFAVANRHSGEWNSVHAEPKTFVLAANLKRKS